jgi:hypothetical protein
VLRTPVFAVGAARLDAEMPKPEHHAEGEQIETSAPSGMRRAAASNEMILLFKAA